LKPDEAGMIPLAGVLAELASLLPNTGGCNACAVVVFEAGGLLNGFVIGCTVGADELFGMPKLNMSFGGAPDCVGAARGLDGVTLVGLLVIPKPNCGCDASLVPPAGTALALGLELFPVEVGGLGFCPSVKGIVLEPFPCGANGGFDIGLFDCAFVCPKEKNEDAGVSGAGEGFVVVVKKVVVELDGMGPLAAGIDVEVCVTGFGAEGKGNKVAGAVAVLASGLSFASPDWAF
jgi:hypothetical protein